MGQTHVEFRKRVQLNEYRADHDEQENVTFVGGFSQDRPLPEDNSAFFFDPAPNVFEAESFATESASVLTTRLFMVFGAFDLVSVSADEWSVERPGEILGKVKVYCRASGVTA
ncbi:MAG: hypothetical protein E7Z70_01640 [Thermoplasmata archaeon]|nr:hypothetical protein [Thermoplasmata archaeon]